MPRIAVGGFHHETNTFAPIKATWRDFVEGSSWPGLQRGPALLEGVAGINLPVAGAIDGLRELGHEIVPLVWAAATPSAHVTREAFENVAAMMLSDLADAGPLDGVLLDLHGAMVAEHLDDGEGELLRRVRSTIGTRLPIVLALDFHANVTPAMVALADAMTGYETYPHVDLQVTGRRAADLIDRILGGEAFAGKALRQIPYLVPLTAQCTLIEPAGELFRARAAIARETGAMLAFFPGFPAADIADCGPSVVAFARDQAIADGAAERMADLVLAAEPRWDAGILQPDDAVAEALRLSAAGARPIVLADTQDNPGAGGSSDTVGVLEALLRARADEAVVAVLTDPDAARAAHAAGVGATLHIGLGGKSGAPGQAPLHGAFIVERVSDGAFTATGPMYSGARVRLGAMALLRIAGVRVVVASRKMQAADQAIFRHLGIEPAEQRILALKSSVHFRADFQPIAGRILVVAAPGAMIADPAALGWTKLRAGMRLRPLGQPLARPPAMRPALS